MSEIDPQLQRRRAQPYLAIHAHVTSEAEFRHAADTGFPALFAWLGEHGVEPAGPIFIRSAAGRATLEAWADAQGLTRGDYVEHDVKGPVEEPDHARWETELASLTTA